MKWWSLCWMSACIGGALGCLMRKDYSFAILNVVCCAVNHFCYNVWTKRIKDADAK